MEQTWSKGGSRSPPLPPCLHLNDDRNAVHGDQIAIHCDQTTIHEDLITIHEDLITIHEDLITNESEITYWLLLDVIWSFKNTQNIYCINCTNTGRTAIPFWWSWKCVSCLVALSEWYGHVETKIYLQIIGLPNNFVEYNTTQFPIKCQVDFAVWVRMNEMFCNNLSNYCLIVRIQKGRLGVRQDCRRPSNISILSLGPNLVYIRYIVLILFVWWRIIIHHYYYSDIVEQRVLLP